ncbi:hypothetical protein ES754_00760 [Psychrobacter frigidicola]|uniref:Uncharacterized protein n=1 Tax=Psychrobacter frigidicola TaxID=45611 RepID=A0A5C7A4I8_9GAMM|nr:hypothetical protein [Psychrobacter frigidicola]TXD97550.1 hypothetical protein ES754_00760 [Psychrobacter frigidicola]
MIDLHSSVEIYDHLMNGRIVNKRRLGSHGSFEPNPMFEEVIKNLDVYKNQYDMCGFSLLANTEFIYIIKGNAYELGKTEIAMKAYCLLLIIGKYVTSHNYKVDKLNSASGGLTLSDIDKIGLLQDTAEILQRAGMNEDMFKSIKSTLIERQIMFENPITQNFVLSDSGMAFYEELTADFIVG